MKRKLVVFIILILLMITSTVIGAFLTHKEDKTDNFHLGHVDVEVFAYFQRGNSMLEEDYKVVDMSSASGGVVTIDISDDSKLEHFDNFKVKIKIHSSVDTYFRVAIYEQFTHLCCW